MTRKIRKTTRKTRKTTIKKRKYNKKMNGGELVQLTDEQASDDCPICYNSFGTTEEIRDNTNNIIDKRIFRTNCNHLFHIGCLYRVCSNNNKTCPICRTPLRNQCDEMWNIMMPLMAPQTTITNENIKDLVNKYINKHQLPIDLKNKNIGDWDVSNVTDMSGLFDRCYVFNEPLNN